MAVYERFKKIFTDLGFTKFGKFDGFCPLTTKINVYGSTKDLKSILKAAFDVEGHKLYLDDKAYNFVFSDMSSFGRHENRLTIY